MPDPLCRREDFHLCHPLPYLPTPTRRYVNFPIHSNQRSHSPDSIASSSASSTVVYSMVGRGTEVRGGIPSSGHMITRSVNMCGSHRTPRDLALFTIRTYQLKEPVNDRNPLFAEDAFRSRSLEPSPYNAFKRHRVTAAPFITNSLVRLRPYQHPHVTFNTPESDYETPEKIWQRDQRIAASFQRSESARVSQRSHRRLSRSSSGHARAHIDTDATPKATPIAPEDITLKSSHFGARKRLTGLTASLRPELRAPLCQRKRIRSVNIENHDSENDDCDVKVEAKPTTLAEIVVKKNGVYEIEEPKMAGPSRLLQALKEVKHAEKEQLGSTSQAEPQRITLFDLITEKDRRHKARSPPPIPPKPTRRVVSFTERSSVKEIESSMPKAVDALKPLNFFQSFPAPPSLPTPPKCVSLRGTPNAFRDASTTPTATSKVIGDQKILKAPTLPISENPFVQWDRVGAQSIQKTTYQISSSPQKFAKDVHSETEPSSPCSSGVGTEGFEEDGPAIATAYASSTSSVNASNSSSSPDWPKPEKITARPQSHQCSPDPFDDRKVRGGSAEKSVNENAEIHTHQDRSPIRVSLIAAPKRNAPIFDGSLLEAASDTSNSSRTSTIFSYPWDLPPPQSGQSSSSSTMSPFPLKWATLQRHLSQIDSHSPPQYSTLKPKSVETKAYVDNGASNYGSKEKVFKSSEVKLTNENAPQIERKDYDKTFSELLLDMFADNAKILRDESFSKDIKVNQRKQFQREEEPYDMIGDDSGVDGRIIECALSMEVPSPNLKISSATDTDFSQNHCTPQYIYAEVKPSSDTSTSSSFAIHTPSVPSHPAKSKLAVPEINPYEEIEIGRDQLPKIEPEILSSTDFSLQATEPLNQGNGESESRSSSKESGKHLELFVCGLLNDKNSFFCKYVSTFIGCTIKQIGEAPQNTLQNMIYGELRHDLPIIKIPGWLFQKKVRQFMDGINRFLRNSHESELQQALKAEERDLRGLQYFDVAQELERLIQLTILRPLHRRLIENLSRHCCGTILPRIAEEFANLVKKEYENLGETERQRMENQLVNPVKRTFVQLNDAFQPGTKLEHLVHIFQCIDSQVPDNPTSEQTQDSQGLIYVQAKLLIYAVIFALADLLKPTKRSSSKLCHQNDEGEKCCISRIEVQRLYLEALISPACLASSSEGCRRLTDLVCLLRYVNDFRRYGSPINLVRCICRYQRQSTGPDGSIQSPNLHKLRRSPTANIQEVSQQSSNAELSTGFSTPFWKDSFRCMSGRERCFILPGSASFSRSSFIVLAVNELEKKLVPFEISLRSSLTVRELCNMLALKMSVFDSRDFALFFHSSTGDIPMSDTIHLEPFLTHCLDEGCQANVDDSALSVRSPGSIDHMSGGASQPSTPKISPLRRLFGRQKHSTRVYSSLGNLESPRETRTLNLSRLLYLNDSQKDERHPSIDWGSLSRRHPKFVLVYRRRSSESVLYASDLFDCLPNVGKPI